MLYAGRIGLQIHVRRHQQRYTQVGMHVYGSGHLFVMAHQGAVMRQAEPGQFCQAAVAAVHLGAVQPPACFCLLLLPLLLQPGTVFGCITGVVRSFGAGGK